MNKLKLFFGLLLAGVAVSTVSIGAGMNRTVKEEVHADPIVDANTYSIIGKLQNYSEDWSKDHDLAFETSGNDGKIVINFKSGDKFKIRLSHDWATSYGATKLVGTHTGFSGIDDIEVSVNGYYQITFNKSSESISISNVSVTTQRVYFDIDSSGVQWNNGFSLYAYHYGASSACAAWPGNSIMNNTVHQFDRDIYYSDIPIDAAGVIFVRSPNNEPANAYHRWNVSYCFRLPLGYNFFQPKWWDNAGTHEFYSWSDAGTVWGDYDGNSGGCEFGGYKAYNATLHINATTSTELAVSWGGYTPASPSIAGQEFVGWYTNSGLTTKYTSITPTSNLTLYAKFAVSAKIVNYSGTEGDSLALSATEWSVTCAFTAGSKFKIVKTYNNNTTEDFYVLQDGLSSIATYADGYVTILNAGTYSMYLKLGTDADNPNKIYIMVASDSSEAYSFADYFLANIGCDPSGLDVPTGWTDCATRYSTLLSGDAKHFIFAFDVEAKRAEEPTDKIVLMIDRYEWAVKHNPNGLSEFITDRDGTTKRPISNSRFVPMIIAINNQSGAAPIIVSVIAVLSLTAIGGYYFLKKGKKEKENTK